MKPSKNHRDTLLDDLLPTAGPGPDVVLDVVRVERARRQWRRGLLVAVSVVALGALLLMRGHLVPEAVPVAVKTAEPEPVVIRTVDDLELLALLDGVPAALMEWPDGRRTLLVLVLEGER